MAELFEEISKFSRDKGLDNQIKVDSEVYAQRVVKNLLDPDHNPPVESFPVIDISKTKLDRDEYIIVHDFFKSSQLPFPAQVLMFESQNPEFRYNRKMVCKRLGLDPGDDSPMLCQILRKRAAVRRRG